MTSGESVVSLMGLTSCRVRCHMRWGKCQMSQLVPYYFVPPLKEVYCTTPIFLGIRSRWGGDEYYGLFYVGYYVTPRYPKGKGGYEDIYFSKIYHRDYNLHEAPNYG